jgi:hypothetical protein
MKGLEGKERRDASYLCTGYVCMDYEHHHGSQQITVDGIAGTVRIEAAVA